MAGLLQHGVPHSRHGILTPDEAYAMKMALRSLAA